MLPRHCEFYLVINKLLAINYGLRTFEEFSLQKSKYVRYN